MGIIAKTQPSKPYRNRRQISKDMNERKDCAVIAVSIACQVTYQVAHAALKTAGRRNRCGTKNTKVRKAIEALGFKVREWSRTEYNTMLKSYGLPPSKRYTTITTHHPRQTSQGGGVSDAWQDVHPNILFVTCNHIGAFRNHKLQDWSINNALYVKWVWEIDPA